MSGKPCPDCAVHEDMTRCQAKLMNGQKVTWGGILAILLSILALFLAGCGGDVAGYDPQCAVDVAQECVEKMHECKAEPEPEEPEEEAHDEAQP